MKVVGGAKYMCYTTNTALSHRTERHQEAIYHDPRCILSPSICYEEDLTIHFKAALQQSYGYSLCICMLKLSKNGCSEPTYLRTTVILHKLIPHEDHVVSLKEHVVSYEEHVVLTFRYGRGVLSPVNGATVL